MHIKLGQNVVDTSTGFKGMCNLICEYIQGTIQIQIQPPCEDDNLRKVPEITDYNLVEVIDDGISLTLPSVEQNVTIQLGQTVTDLITGHTGIATQKLTSLNGCVEFFVVAKINPETQQNVSDYFDHKRLVPVPGVPLLVIARNDTGPTKKAAHRGMGS